MIESILLQYENPWRLGFFLGTLGVMAVWELIAPKRPLSVSKSARWFSNLGIVALDMVLVRYLVPVLPVGLALWMGEKGWGFFNILELPFWMSLVPTILIFDFVIYVQHVSFHYFPFLWRFHAMHHTDLDLDVTSGNRFHPVEIFISVAVKTSVVFVIGPPPETVIIFEIILNGLAQFNHSNVSIPGVIDRYLRLLVVTPDMHRVHHSVMAREFNQNFGFNFPWWDRFFKTYTAQPREGHQGMAIGLRDTRDLGKLNLLHLLIFPFRKEIPTNRSQKKKEVMPPQVEQ